MSNEYTQQIAAIVAQLPSYLCMDDPMPVTHPVTQRKYTVTLEHDSFNGAPQEDCDGHGETYESKSRIDPDDIEAINDHLGLYDDDDSVQAMEQRLRFSMMRPLREDSYRWGSHLYYDVWETLKKAKAECWGSIDHDNDPEADEKLQAIVDKDYDYLRGWHNDEWCWVTVCVTPLDEDDEPMDQHAQYVGGYEHGFDRDAERPYFAEAILDQMECAEHSIRAEEHAGQMELPLT